MPPGPAHKLEESIQANRPPSEKCLKQTGVFSVTPQKLEEYIQAYLKPNEESLKQLDQAVDAISELLLRSEIPVMKVAKVRAGARAQDPRRVHCSYRCWC